MVEKLTDKNLSLGEEVTELRSLVHHLEAVVRASEDIEDEHVAVETQLQRARASSIELNVLALDFFLFFLFLLFLGFDLLITPCLRLYGSLILLCCR